MGLNARLEGRQEVQSSHCNLAPVTTRLHHQIVPPRTVLQVDWKQALFTSEPRCNDTGEPPQY
jgi:hypothetical protein